MTYKCAFCDKDEYSPKWFVNPTTIVGMPTQYSVCKDHKDLSIDYYDVYPDGLDNPITRHEYKLKDVK